MRIRAFAAAGVMLVAAVATVASGSSNEAEKVDGDGSTAPAQTTFSVGDQVKLGDWTVVVNSVQVPLTSTNEFDQPDPGNQYIGADTSVTNNGAKPQTVSSLVCFKLRDGSGQSYSEALVVGAPDAPGGEVAPGQTIRGTLTYEVPATATGLVLEFKCDLFSSGSASIQLT